MSAKTSDRNGALPLSGIRVIDFTQVMMGPVCTQMLGDYGADVIKIERAGAGDLSRTTFPPTEGIDNPIFCSLNRNKRSVALDLRSAESMAAVKTLIADADVVVNNFRAGVMARKADPSHPMATYATALADYSAGMHMVQGILLALLQRERSGEGQKISVSLYNSMLAMQMQEAAMILMRDQEVNWAAMPLSGVFECADQPLVLVGAFKANPLRDICAALGLPDLSLEARFANLEQQFAHKAELQGMFRERFRTQPRDHWLARLEARDLLCAPVRDMREVLVDPQTVHNAMVMEGPAAGGTQYRFIASPITMSAAPVTLSRVPPRLGEHTDEVLAEAAAGKTRGRP